MERKKSLKKLLYFSLALILLAALILSACSTSTTTTAPGTKPSATTVKPTTASSTSVTPKSGGTLRIGYNRDAVYLGDPIELTQQQDMVMSRPAIETLARYDSSGKLVPWLATGWTVNADNLTMTIALRKGVKFHDGTDFNADAVKFNLDRFRASKRSELALVKSVDVVDEYTVRVGISTWDNTVDGSLLYYAGNMMSPQAFQKNGKEWAEKNPIGTGPFKFASWERDVSIKYQKNPDYWQKGKPYLDKIEFYIIADAMVRLASLDRREIDVLERAEMKDVDQLKASGKYNVFDQDYVGLGVNMMVPDSAHADSPYANLKVRQAISYAIDKQALVNTVLSGHGIVATQYSEPRGWGYNPNIKGYPYDVNKAKQLLTEAGYPSGFKTTVLGKVENQLQLTAIQGFLSKVGITAEVFPMSATQFNDISGTKGWTNGLNVMDLRGGPDTALLIPRYYGPKAKPAWLTSTIRPDEEIKAMNEAIAARTQDAKTAATYNLQSIIFDQYLISIPLYHQTLTLVQYPNIHDSRMFIADGSVWTPEDAWIGN
jgi:peptide/nickel transport system substrate-binding protein